MPKAKSAAAKALEVDDHLAEAPASLGYASFTPFILSTSVLSVVMKKPWRWRERGSGASLGLLGYAHARSGERNEALRMIEELRAASKHGFVPAFFFALVYAGLEDRDLAFAWLEKVHEERFNRLAYLKSETLWDPLRSDSRLADLVRRIGIPQ